MSNQFQLLRQRRFAPLFVTQFLGAFNDNLYKNALVVLLTYQTASWTSLPPAIMVNLAAGIFILPFFLFSASAGQLADNYDKAAIARLAKLLEILIVLVAALGFWLHALPVLLAALFMLGLQSTLFGPVKYSILPQQLHRDELLGANALVEAGTFAAILLGTLSGGLLAAAEQAALWIIGGALLVAVAGYLASTKIPPALPVQPLSGLRFNPLRQTLDNLALARRQSTVFYAILAISWFWLYGALLLAQLPVYSKQELGGNEITTTLLLAVFTLGIGSGSLLCERLSARQVEVALVPLGAAGLTLFGMDLLFAAPDTWRVCADLFLLGAFGGLYIVPLYALVQLRSASHERARIIATNNILNALFMVAGALAAIVVLACGVKIPQLFALLALLNALFTCWLLWRNPQFYRRLRPWLQRIREKTQ